MVNIPILRSTSGNSSKFDVSVILLTSGVYAAGRSLKTYSNYSMTISRHNMAFAYEISNAFHIERQLLPTRKNL